VLKKAYNFCKYKTQGPQEIFVVLHHQKNAWIVTLINPTFFFPCQLWSTLESLAIAFSLSRSFLFNK
jgi:hypothetical protein